MVSAKASKFSASPSIEIPISESEDLDRFSISARCHAFLHPIALTSPRIDLCGLFKKYYLSRMFNSFEFCLPTKGLNVPDGPDWLHEVKYDGLYEASRVKKFFEINIFSFPAFQEASRRVSAVLH